MANVESGKAHDIFERYRAALAYIEVELSNGDLSIGSTFHVGEGVFVTARHVVEGNKILKISSTERTYIPLTGDEAIGAKVIVHRGEDEIPSHVVNNGQFEISEGPYFHAHDDVDVAVFRVRQIDPKTPAVELGSHLDDWLGQGDFVLSEAVVLGYPPVPMTKQPVLIGARAEVNTQVDLYDTSHVHFILSTMPRGGFSGGVAISEYGFALGVITRSLASNYSPVEMGFMTVIGVEPIYDCLAQHYLLPDAQAEGWDGLWNSTHLYFYDPEREEPMGKGYITAASLDLFDDAKKYALTIICNDRAALDKAVKAAIPILSQHAYSQKGIRSGMIRFDIPAPGDEIRPDVRRAGQVISQAFISHGYQPIPYYTGNNPLLPPPRHS